jgi:hypothetical protein
MTRRIVKAIRNPNVDAIGHPSGRLIGHREPSEFDLGEVLRAARMDRSGRRPQHTSAEIAAQTLSHSSVLPGGRRRLQERSRDH